MKILEKKKCKEESVKKVILPSEQIWNSNSLKKNKKLKTNKDRK